MPVFPETFERLPHATLVELCVRYQRLILMQEEMLETYLKLTEQLKGIIND